MLSLGKDLMLLLPCHACHCFNSTHPPYFSPSLPVWLPCTPPALPCALPPLLLLLLLCSTALPILCPDRHFWHPALCYTMLCFPCWKPNLVRPRAALRRARPGAPHQQWEKEHEGGWDRGAQGKGWQDGGIQDGRGS